MRGGGAATKLRWSGTVCALWAPNQGGVAGRAARALPSLFDTNRINAVYPVGHLDQAQCNPAVDPKDKWRHRHALDRAGQPHVLGPVPAGTPRRVQSKGAGRRQQRGPHRREVAPLRVGRCGAAATHNCAVRSTPLVRAARHPMAPRGAARLSAGAPASSLRPGALPRAVPPLGVGSSRRDRDKGLDPISVSAFSISVSGKRNHLKGCARAQARPARAPGPCLPPCACEGDIFRECGQDTIVPRGCWRAHSTLRFGLHTAKPVDCKMDTDKK